MNLAKLTQVVRDVLDLLTHLPEDLGAKARDLLAEFDREDFTREDNAIIAGILGNIDAGGWK
jgi:hypothetical protein